MKTCGNYSCCSREQDHEDSEGDCCNSRRNINHGRGRNGGHHWHPHHVRQHFHEANERQDPSTSLNKSVHRRAASCPPSRDLHLSGRSFRQDRLPFHRHPHGRTPFYHRPHMPYPAHGRSHFRNLPHGYPPFAHPLHARGPHMPHPAHGRSHFRNLPHGYPPFAHPLHARGPHNHSFCGPLSS